jgi:hypothetical protein
MLCLHKLLGIDMVPGQLGVAGTDYLLCIPLLQLSTVGPACGSPNVAWFICLQAAERIQAVEASAKLLVETNMTAASASIDSCSLAPLPEAPVDGKAKGWGA